MRVYERAGEERGLMTTWMLVMAMLAMLRGVPLSAAQATAANQQHIARCEVTHPLR